LEDIIVLDNNGIGDGIRTSLESKVETLILEDNTQVTEVKRPDRTVVENGLDILLVMRQSRRELRPS